MGTTVEAVTKFDETYRQRMLIASCIALIVTAMSFAIRGALIAPLGEQFNLSKEQIGWVVGTAFWGFTLAMIIGGPLCDVLGMGRLLVLAFIGHTIGIFLTIFASGFWTLFFSTLAFGLGNGFVEAACNPLIATIYPDQKIKRLNQFHMWFPGGIVIGGLVSFAITRTMGEGAWKIQMASMLIPLAVYAFLFLGKKFPATERAASGVSTADMFKACANPFFILFAVCMCMTAVTELGPQQWFPNILSLTTGIDGAGILFLIWITGLMAVGRGFAGPIVHRMSPVAMLIGSSVCSAIGLYLISAATSAVPAAVGATVFAAGVCFYWPTMLGIVSERFPKTGALGLAIMGGIGMLASSFGQPVIGRKFDLVTAQQVPAGMTMEQFKAAAGAAWAQAQAVGGAAAIRQVVILPIIVLVVFTLIFFYDKSRGGYKKETLTRADAPAGEIAEEAAVTGAAE